MTINLSLTPALPPLGMEKVTRPAVDAVRRSGAADAPKEFEAVVLQSFIQELMPKTAETVFGGGVAGDIWRSMLAEKLAAEFASRGGIGIAELIGSGGSGRIAAAPAPGDNLRALAASLNIERS